MTDPGDELKLFEAWKAGDTAAGNTLFERHFDALYAFFETRVNDNAEDLVQQTFLAALSPGATYRGDSSFRSYLLAAARSKLLDYFRMKQRKQAPLDFRSTTLREIGTPLSTKMERRQEYRLLLEAMHAIPLDLQIAVDLFYFKDMSAREVAMVIDVPQGTVRSRLRRALSLLREQLEMLAPHDAHVAMTELDRLAKKGE